jgi:hypothetical protein
MKWAFNQENKPQETGLYWFRYSDRHPRMLMDVHVGYSGEAKGQRIANGDNRMQHLDSYGDECEWAGPIPVPDSPQNTTSPQGVMNPQGDVGTSISVEDGWHDCSEELPDYMRFTDGRPYNMTPPVEVKTFKGRTYRAFARLDWIDPVSGDVWKWERPVKDGDGKTTMWSDDHIVAWRPDPACSYRIQIVSARPIAQPEEGHA